jgi:hypothetical protein
MEGLIIKINQPVDVFPISSKLVSYTRQNCAVQLILSEGETCTLLVGRKHEGKNYYVDEYIKFNVINDHNRRFITRGINTASSCWGRKLSGEKPKQWILRSSFLIKV